MKSFTVNDSILIQPPTDDNMYNEMLDRVTIIMGTDTAFSMIRNGTNYTVTYDDAVPVDPANAPAMVAAINANQLYSFRLLLDIQEGNEIERAPYVFILVGPWAGTLEYPFTFSRSKTTTLHLPSFSTTSNGTTSSIRLKDGEELNVLAPNESKIYPMIVHLNGVAVTGSVKIEASGMIKMYAGVNEEPFNVPNGQTVGWPSTTIVYDEF